EQSRNVKTPVFADDDEDLRKSLEKARRLALKNQEEKGVFRPQAIAVIASSNPCNETVDDQISTARKSRENKIVFREIKESVWRHRINEEARILTSSDTPSLFVERMREAQARMKKPYLVLSGDVKPENFSGLKRKAEQISS
ncbi:SART-1 family protein, partial [Trifolium pratense]